MNELESDVLLSQKGENIRGPLLHWECFKPLLTMKCMALFQIVYICLRIYHFSSKTV